MSKSEIPLTLDNLKLSNFYVVQFTHISCDDGSASCDEELFESQEIALLYANQIIKLSNFEELKKYNTINETYFEATYEYDHHNFYTLKVCKYEPLKIMKLHQIESMAKKMVESNWQLCENENEDSENEDEDEDN